MHGECYRKGNGQPYTRKEYIKGKPQIKITKFQSGSADRLQNYDYSVQLLINEKMQITHMAIEATRLAANKTLEKTTGETGYFSKLRIYPHVLLRENKMIAAAGADRLQEGMRRAFGKAVSLAARVKRGQRVISIQFKPENYLVAKDALRKASMKFPTPCTTKLIRGHEHVKGLV